MLYMQRRMHPILRFRKLEEDKEKAEIENAINQKILDAILDDDDDLFTQLITENSVDHSKLNQSFKMSNYKIPDILHGNPSYASLCACFNAENCFTALSLLLPAGTSSEEMKKVDRFKRSLIHFACIGGSLNIIRELDQAMFDLNARDEMGYFPSHYAAMAGNLDVIKYLFTKGADLTSPSFMNETTPLQLACFHGNLDIVQFLCETVLKAQFQSENKDQNLKPSDDFLRHFLSSKREPTPLHYACEGGHDNIVNYFISKPELLNLQINSLDKNSRNPFLCACHNGSLKCVKALLNGAKDKIKLDMKGRKHLPLVDAADGGYLDVVQFLIKQKKIKIQQETSENISALHAAVLNDHLNVVKFLIQNGAADNLSKDKIGHIFFSALKRECFNLIHYLDEVLQIPYKEKYEVEQTSQRSNYHYRTLVKENELKNLTYGDFFMQQACLLENKEMVQFLLDKNCSLDMVDITKILNTRTIPFVEFLIEKGFDLSCSKNQTITPPIVKLISIGNMKFINEFIDKGAILNKEIILKYNLLEQTIRMEKVDIFKFLMKYKPELSPEHAMNLLRRLIDRYNYKFYLIGVYSDFIESILSNYQIDLNSPMNSKVSNATFVSNACSYKNLKFLQIFEKYGADFTNCPLSFESMTMNDYLKIYEFLKAHGCKFDKRVIKNLDRDKQKVVHLCPLHKIFTSLNTFDLKNSDSIIIFMLDYSTPNQIINAKNKRRNLIDYFMRNNIFYGAFKAFTNAKAIFYPLACSASSFNEWVMKSNNQLLINLVFKSGLPIAKPDKKVVCEYDDDINE